MDVLSEVPTRFRRGARLGARGKDGSRRALTVRASRPHTRGLILSFDELDDRDAAATLSGAALEVSRDAVPPAPEDRWYPFELVGCRCVDRVSGDLGEVVDVVEDGGGLLLRVVGDGREILVPFVRAMVPVVDSRARRIEVVLPEGFLEIL